MIGVSAYSGVWDEPGTVRCDVTQRETKVEAKALLKQVAEHLDEILGKVALECDDAIELTGFTLHVHSRNADTRRGGHPEVDNKKYAYKDPTAQVRAAFRSTLYRYAGGINTSTSNEDD